MSAEKRCGTCDYWEPVRNPATGRILPSEPAACKYVVFWPVMPASYHRYSYSGRHEVPFPNPAHMRRDDGTSCPTYKPKK